MEDVNEINAIGKSLKRVQKFSRIASRFFRMLFWLAASAYLAVFVFMSVNGIVDYGPVRVVPLIASLVKIGFELFASLFMIWVLKSIFCDIASGASPFTSRQAKRLRVAGVLSLIHAFVCAISSPAFLVTMGLEGAALGATIGSASAEGAMRFIPVNAGDIVLAVVLFCAALIVEYGSLLQQLSDDTL